MAHGRPPGPTTVGGVQGENGYRGLFEGSADLEGTYGGWDGPFPPWNDEHVHHYVTTVFALDVESLALEAGFDFQAFRRAIEGHVLASAEIVPTYKVNDELRRFEHDESISPTRSLMAMLFGWIIIVPPFIAIWNTANHIQAAERRAGVLQQIEPVLVLVFQIVFSLVNPPYMQDHLNRIWAGGAAAPPLPGGPGGALPSPPSG